MPSPSPNTHTPRAYGNEIASAGRTVRRKRTRTPMANWVSANREFHTARCGARKWPTLMMAQWMTAGCPEAWAVTYFGTKFLENMKGWNCSAVSSIQNRPRAICRTRCALRSGRGERISGVPRAPYSSMSPSSSMAVAHRSGPPRACSVRSTPGAPIAPRSGVGDRCQQLLQCVLGIAEQHRGLGVVEKLVVDAGKAGAHGALEKNDVLRLVGIDDRHAVDGAAWSRVGGRVHRVVGPDDEGHIRCGHLGIGLVHLLELVVRNVGLGQQDVHVPRHASCHRVYGVGHIDSLGHQRIGQLAHRVLRLGRGQAV